MRLEKIGENISCGLRYAIATRRFLCTANIEAFL